MFRVELQLGERDYAFSRRLFNNNNFATLTALAVCTLLSAIWFDFVLSHTNPVVTFFSAFDA